MLKIIFWHYKGETTEAKPTTVESVSDVNAQKPAVSIPPVSIPPPSEPSKCPFLRINEKAEDKKPVQLKYLIDGSTKTDTLNLKSCPVCHKL